MKEQELSGKNRDSKHAIGQGAITEKDILFSKPL